MPETAEQIAVVVPCYRAKSQILAVLESLPEMVDSIYCVDDGCPDGTADTIETHFRDPRLRVLRHDRNRGVGAAMVTGYRQALADNATIIVKIDADGQMNPADMPRLIRPIQEGQADYCKGNRFYNLDDVRQMPVPRIFGNAILTFMAKLSTGYWNLFDPTNGYTAIHAAVLRQLPLERLHLGYFFETDLLFRLSTIRAVIADIPMQAQYGDETSNLRISNVLWPFLAGHIGNFFKRIFYSYYLRDFQLASIEFVLGIILLAFGTFYGIYEWGVSATLGRATPAGTVMVAALPIIIGFQMLLAALNYDIANTPKQTIHDKLPNETGSN